MEQAEEETRREKDRKTIWVPIPETGPERYITGLEALNIEDPKHPWSRDWHQGVWEDPLEQGGSALTNEDFPRGVEVCKALGTEGLRDARASLEQLGHPGGKAREKIWCAGHTRAMIELEWERLHWALEDGRDYATCRWFDMMEAERILSSGAQYVELHTLARKLDRLLDEEGKRQWQAWRHSMGPRGSRYDGSAWDPGRISKMFWTMEEQVRAMAWKIEMGVEYAIDKLR